MNNTTNQTGYYHFRVWRAGDYEVVGEALSIFEYQAYINNGWTIFGFDGRRGTVCILVKDFTITRIDCLKFAIAFMEGKLSNVAIDLDKCTSTITRVIPPP